MRRALTSLMLCASVAACTGDNTSLVTVEPPPDGGCVLDESPRTYAIYFILDVSGSMSFFLERLALQLQTFAESFPEEDSEDNPVFVDYYVVAFVNDVRWFPDGAARRMTSPVAVQAAIEQARLRGETNLNLNIDALNADTEENLLDAIGAVVDSNPSADLNMVIIATDATFAEAPDTLSPGITVQTSYDEALAGLERIDAQVHVFVPGEVDGLTRNFKGMPPITTLGGSTINPLEAETGSAELIESALTNIAERTACQ